MKKTKEHRMMIPLLSEEQAKKMLEALKRQEKSRKEER